MEKYIVDRTEDGIIVLEKDDGTHFELNETSVPFKVSEGNVFLRDNSGSFIRDETEEKVRRERIFEKQKNIFKNK